MGVKIKRVYDPPKGEDGYRVLVDGLWPRGLRREDAALDDWLRSIAPSTELRRWFGHRPELWPEFRRRYFEELKEHVDLLDLLLDRAEKGRVTLLYGARDPHCNNAAALRDWLEEKRAKEE